MGCHTLCCRLFVGLSFDDIDAGLQEQSPQSMLLKQEKDGFCTYLGRDDHRCTVWDRRPLACRMYDCNKDPKLQVMLREGYTSFGRAIEVAKTIDPADYIMIPLLDPAGGD